MIINSQRTIYGLDLQMSKMLNRGYKIRSNTTLNEKFDINANTKLADGVYPSVNYYAIGVGGKGNIVINNEDPALNAINRYNISKHSPVDAALFEHIPFVMRPLNSDLLENERANYRFRKTITVNGDVYVAYYLKVIDHSYTIQDIYMVNVADEVSKLSKFNSNDSSLLNPTPRDVSSDLLSVNTAKYITNAAKLNFSLTTTELVEITNVLKLLYNDENKSITEIGVCTGVDVETDGQTLATNVQIAYHLEIDIVSQLELNNNSEIHRSIEIGGTEPLIV